MDGNLMGECEGARRHVCKRWDRRCGGTTTFPAMMLVR